MNSLYYGDNLDILREHIEDNMIDLIYLDLPFNSKATYNILFSEKNGKASVAQIKAFEDSWHWDRKAEETYREIVEKSPKKVADLIKALRGFLGSNDMMAYLVMMAIRLVELHRVLKETGSIYLHCDPTASHYLKLLMDAVFGVDNFKNEVVWKRFNFHADANRFGNVSDRIFFYTKSSNFVFNRRRVPFSEKYINTKFIYADADGRKYRLDNLNPPGGRGPIYEFHGVTKPWRFTKEKMLQLETEGRIYSDSKIPQLKRYLDELSGQAIHDLWGDIPAINSQAKERLGYPTQKPEVLLERIIKASSNEGDLVLDPFCGCGTTIVTAEKLKRRWIGIDITHLAISLMRHRLEDTFGDEVEYEVIGEPIDLRGAEALKEEDPYQFQWWALGLVGAMPIKSEKKKGADTGIDGYIYFHDDLKRTETKTIIIQVKSGHVKPADIRDLKGVVERENAQIGVFITLSKPTRHMKEEAISAGFYKSPLGHDYPKIQIITIEELLEGKDIDYPSKFTQVDATFRKAKRYQKKEKPSELFDR
jgi:site-specific DNA-methyltransferase (adenine-specific)